MNKFERKAMYAPLARKMRSEGAKLIDIGRRFGITRRQAGRWCEGVTCPINHNGNGLGMGPTRSATYNLNHSLRRKGVSREDRIRFLNELRSRSMAEAA